MKTRRWPVLGATAMMVATLALAGCGAGAGGAAGGGNAQAPASEQAKEAAYQRATEGKGIVNTFITDKFYDGKVTDEASAEKCVMSIIDRLGGNDKTELELNSVRATEGGLKVVTLQQRVGGVLVYGSTVKLIVDKDDNPIAVVGSIMPDVQLEPLENWAVDAAKAEQIVMDKLKAEGSSDKLVEGTSDRAIIEIPGTQNNYTCV